MKIQIEQIQVTLLLNQLSISFNNGFYNVTKLLYWPSTV